VLVETWLCDRVLRARLPRSVDREPQQSVVCVDVVKDSSNSVTDPYSGWIVRYQPGGEARAGVEFHDGENLGLIGRE
jgi:hypothetical protein